MSSTPACGKKKGSSGIQAMRLFTAGFSYTGSPEQRTAPASGLSTPVTQRMAVVLPAPLGPTRP